MNRATMCVKLARR